LKLADEHYLELTNGGDILYSAYAANSVDTKRGNLTSEETGIVGAEADIVEIRNMTIVDGRFFTKRKSKMLLMLQLSGMN